MNLPELPEPAGQMLSELQSGLRPYYTEAQMLALRAATVEACAVVCESLYGKDMTDAPDKIREMK